MPLFPRIILVKPYMCYLNDTARTRDEGATAVTSSVPTLLCVNREARYELLQHFFNPFASRFCGKRYSFRTPPLEHLQINYHLDVVFILNAISGKHPRSNSDHNGDGIRTLYVLSPQDLLGIKERDAIVRKRDSFWTKNHGGGCIHWNDMKWLKDWPKLESLAKDVDEELIDQEVSMWRLTDEFMFGPKSSSYWRKLLPGNNKPPIWYVEKHKPNDRTWKIRRRPRLCSCAPEHICPDKEDGDSDDSWRSF